MKNQQTPETRVFCGTDLTTSDVKGAKRFYHELFGWTATDVENHAGIHTVFELDGHCVSEMRALQRRSQHPASKGWHCAVRVEVITDALVRAVDLGADVIEASTLMANGDWRAVLRDPTGAPFAIRERDEHATAQLTNTVGAVSWHELRTCHPAAAAHFYAQLFDWSTGVQTGDYGEQRARFHLGAAPVAGMLSTGDGWVNDRPSWVAYFTVGNLDEAVDRVEWLGGIADASSWNIHDERRFAKVADPSGARFLISEAGKTAT